MIVAYRKLRRCLRMLRDYAFLRMHGVETQFGWVRLLGFPIIRRHPGSKIYIGPNVELVSHSKYNPAGVNHPVILATLTGEASITIEGNAGISGSSLCSVSSILIREGASLGANSDIYDTDFHPLNVEARLGKFSITDALSAPVIIGNNVWLGADSLVLKGVQIGSGAVIGAKSVVTKNIPENSLAAGIPAKQIRIL